MLDLIDLLWELLASILDLVWLRSSASDEQLGCGAQLIRILLIVLVVAAIIVGVIWLRS